MRKHILAMNAELLTATVTGVLILAYLAYTVLRPEKF